MTHNAEFQFFIKLLKNMDMPVRIFTPGGKEEINQGIDVYFLLYPELSYDEIFGNIVRLCRPACVYHVNDRLFCNYLLFQLPNAKEASYIMIGPYTESSITKEDILANAQALSLSPNLYLQLENFYTNLPRLADSNILSTIVNTFGTVIWGSLEAFVWAEIDSNEESIFPIYSGEVLEDAFQDSYAETKILEDIYSLEAEFLKAVEQGQSHKAEMIMKNYTVNRVEKRLSDSLRNIKNYSIVLNTLLRKAAENGGVHPIHIHKLSSEYAKEIELLTSVEAALKLHKKMVHKYCLLVKNHSLKSYSPLIKKVITNVDADLTADLTLKAQSEELNINASYLSSLFKKEMGVTLTEYVNKSRISYAVNLLNTTNMQVQMIAQYCGISDVNYFTKLFKKYIGKTPQEYRRHISTSA